MAREFTHFDKSGNAIMVDVSDKQVTDRTAVATGRIYVNEEIYRRVIDGDIQKGDVLGVARVAGIMAAKSTSSLIPMCHPLNITGVTIDYYMNGADRYIEAKAAVKVGGQTGVEMEALTAISVTLLTIYDMCKALDKTMRISDIQLLSKTGGKSGDFVNPKPR